MTNTPFSATNPAPVATVREIANELSSHIASLGDRESNIRRQIAEIRDSQSEIKEELDDTIKSFVVKVLPEVSGDKFDRLSTIVQAVPDIMGQSLDFQRSKLLKAREEALAKINTDPNKIIGATKFAEKLVAAQDKLDALTIVAQDKTDLNTTAESNETAWKKTAEYGIVDLNNEIAAKGGKALTSENWKFYEPGFFARMVAPLTRGEDYKRVHEAFADYGHGQKGRDVFAGLPAWQDKDAAITLAVNKTRQDRADAQNALQAQQREVGNLQAVAASIKTDAQIVEAIQTKVATYFKNLAFVAALSTEYGEDLPQAISLATAKINVLQTLSDGLETKLETLREQKAETVKHYQHFRPISSRKPNQPFAGVDLGALRQTNAARVWQYDNFATAADYSRSRVTSYTPSPSTVYVDNSPSFFTQLLIYNMLEESSERRMENQQNFIPCENAPFVANLMGIDATNAAACNLPPSALDLSPDHVAALSDFGISADQIGVGSLPDFDSLSTQIDNGSASGISDALSSFNSGNGGSEPTRNDGWHSDNATNYSPGNSLS